MYSENFLRIEVLGRPFAWACRQWKRAAQFHVGAVMWNGSRSLAVAL